MTRIWGGHTFRFGVEFLRQTAQQRPPFNERGSFTFRTGGGFNAFANFIDNFSGGSGNAAKNFGIPFYTPNLFRKAFLQDTWNKFSDLTLILVSLRVFRTAATSFQFQPSPASIRRNSGAGQSKETK